MDTKSKRPEHDSTYSVDETRESTLARAVEAKTGNDQPVKSLEAEAVKCEPAEASGAEARESAGQQVKTVATRPQTGTGASRVPVPLGPIKQPLKHRWSLWFYKNAPERSWEENLMEVTSFKTLEDFSALYGYIEVASNLEPGCDYYLFKYGNKPMWEDARNRQGGRWLFSMARSRRTSELDSCWFSVMLCLITEEEEFGEFSEDLCGAAVHLRVKADKITVWTADVLRAEANLAIGRTLKERLRMNPAEKVSYHAHSDIQNKKISVSKAKYRV